MKLLSGLLGLTLTSAMALASANAADLYRGPAAGGYKDAYVPVATWTGFYAGVNGGYGWDASKIGDTLAPWSISPEGGFGGGQVGYNWQGFYHPNLVLGIEADFQGADIKDFVTVGSTTVKSSLDYFGTVRGRVGYAFDRALVYATGGLAYGNVTDELSGKIDRTVPFSVKDETTRTGYVVGGGLEYKISPAWSAKGEYQYINLGQDDGWAKVTSEDYAVHTFRVGLNYHFGNSIYEPLK